MAQTNTVLTQIAVKRLSGKAQTNANNSLGQEPKGSTVQTTATTVFAEALPNNPAQTLYLIQSESISSPGTVMFAEFEIRAFGDQYANDGEDGETTVNTYHAYELILSTSFDDGISEADFNTHASTPTSFGTFPFDGGSSMTGSRGRLQIIPEFVSDIPAGVGASNPYIPQLFSTANPDSSPISATDPIDWYLDAFSGILFVQDPVAYGSIGSPNTNAAVPFKIKAFAYVGKYQDQVTFSADDVGLHISASEGTGFSLGNDATASFTSGSGEGLTVTAGPTNNIEFELVNVVSGSAQLPGFHISASTSTADFDISLGETASFNDGGAGLTVETVASNIVQIGKVTDNVQFANLTGSNLLITNTASITYFETTYESSSIIYSSGSTKFGDTNDDTHVFTGSVAILYTGSSVGPEYGLQMSGSNFLIDYGNSGSVTLGTHNVGFEIGSSLPITGSGLIISQSFTNELTTHNMVKIGETELVDISGSAVSDSFLINVRNKSLIISSSDLNRPVVKFQNENSSTGTILYVNGNDEALKITEASTVIASPGSIQISPTSDLFMKVSDGTPGGAVRIPAFVSNPNASPAEVNNYVAADFFREIGGAVTASAVSSSGDLFASLSLESTAGADVLAVVYDTGSGKFFYTGSYGAGGNVTDLETSASIGIHLSASQGTGFSIGLMQSASFTSGSGTGLTVEAGVGTNNIEFTLVGVLSSSAQIATDISGAIDAATGSVLLDYDLLSGSAQIATDISGAIDAATGSVLLDYDLLSGSAQIATEISGAIDAATASLSSSITGTEYEVEVTDGGTEGNIVIGLPDAVRISSSLQVGTQGNDPDDAAITTSHATFNLLDANATTINFGGDATTINMGAAGASNVNIKGSASIDGDLIVKGTTTSINTEQLLVEDPFILLNSGSTGIKDGGIIVQSGSQGSGTALYFDAEAKRWGLTGVNETAYTATSATPKQYVVSVSQSNAKPTGNPNDFGADAAARYGMMYIDTSNADADGNTIWIYSVT